MKLKHCVVLLFLATTAFADIYYNPLISGGADPWCIKSGEYYYYMQTPGSGVYMKQAPYLVNPDFGLGGTGIGSALVFTPPAPNDKDVWAPEVHYINGNWYIYYTAGSGTDASHRMYCAMSTTQSPMGPYTFKGKVYVPGVDYWAIDGTVLVADNGSLFFVWCGKDSTGTGVSRLYIAPMSNPWTISGARACISSPTYGWEGAVNEGPEILKHNGQTYIIYSANATDTDNYCLGQLKNVGNVMDPAGWVKKSTPVFQSTASVFAPGHCSFTKSRDGTQDWIVYHTAQYQGSGYNRKVCTQQFFWNADGSPNFGSPYPTSTPLTVPSGEAAHNTPPVAGLVQPNGAISLHALMEDTSIATCRQTTQGGSWSGWNSLGGAGMGFLRTLIRTNGGEVIFGMSGTPGNDIWMRGQTNWNSTWSAWTSLGGIIDCFEPILYPNGIMAVYATSAGSVWTRWQTAAGNGNWSNWANLGGAGFKTLHVSMRTNGTAVVYGMGAPGGHIWMIYQTSPYGPWSSWVDLGGTIDKFEPVRYPDGRLAVFAISAGSVWYRCQTQASDPGANWGSWVTLGGSGLANIHMLMQTNGAAVAYATGAPNNNIWTCYQTSPYGSWFGWVDLGGGYYDTVSDFTPVLGSNGCISIYAIAGGTSCTRWQNSAGDPGANWSGWAAMGGSFQWQ